MASWPEIVALRIRMARKIYPRWIGPLQSLEICRCTPCSKGPSTFGALWRREIGESAVSAFVRSCCPPGKHVHTPDVVFLEHKLSFMHDSGLTLLFDPEDSVRGCMFDACDSDFVPLDVMPHLVQVRHAERWRKHVGDNSNKQFIQDIEWSYDWTFSTRWWGCPLYRGVALEGVEDPMGELPMGLLIAKDEILW